MSSQRALQVAQVCRIGWPHRGGMESVVGGLSSALVRRGHAVRVVTLDRAITTGEPLPAGIYGGVPYTRLPRVGPRRYPMARGLALALRDVDVVHVHGLDGLLHQALLARRLFRVPVGVTPHGGFLHTRRNRVAKEIWLRTGASAALRAADAVWYTSTADKQALAGARAEGDVLPDGVDVESFAGVVRAPEPGRWLVFGRVDVHKGLDDLIDRLGVLAKRDDVPFRLRVVGAEAAPGLVDALMARARKHGIGHRVRFLGPVAHEDLLVELARCELAFFPSRYEGFGVAVVEAMAAGVPVVVSDIPPHRALVDDDRTGFVVAMRRGEATRRIRALRGNVERVGAAAREAANQHAWSSRVGDWEVAYQQVLAARRGTA